jgi:anti-sigma B factor antagonist
MINIEKRGNVDVVTFNTSKINALVTEEIRTEIYSVFEHHGSKVVFDLTGVDYMDSSGFGVFLSALRKARDSYSFIRLTCLTPQVFSIFETLHLDTVFEIYADREECISTFR